MISTLIDSTAATSLRRLSRFTVNALGGVKVWKAIELEEALHELLALHFFPIYNLLVLSREWMGVIHNH